MEEDISGYPTKVLAEIIVLAALSGVLYAVRPFSLPYGGSVTIGSMVPVMWLSLRRGVRAGCISGAIFGILALIIDVLLLPYSPVANPFQAVVEYPIAFGVLGLAGFFHKKSGKFAIAGVSLAMFIKFLLHYLVGAFIWVYVYEFPPEWGQFVYPLLYNGSFLLVEYIISAILIVALIETKTLDYGL